MAKGYWIAHNPVKDAEVYGAYKIAAHPPFELTGHNFWSAMAVAKLLRAPLTHAQL